MRGRSRAESANPQRESGTAEPLAAGTPASSAVTALFIDSALKRPVYYGLFHQDKTNGESHQQSSRGVLHCSRVADGPRRAWVGATDAGPV